MPYASIQSRSTATAAQIVSWGLNRPVTPARRIVDQRQQTALGATRSNQG